MLDTFNLMLLFRRRWQSAFFCND